MEQLSLLKAVPSEPLASRMRPNSLDDFVGQSHLVGEGGILRRIIESDNIPSMIFWGPPGVGKTTLARIIAKKTNSNFVDFSAVTSGIKEIKKVMEKADNNRNIGIRTIVFVDEIHRFNKAQQDAFLPFVEKGSIILIGATTENPSFEINNALLSRCKVFVLNGLSIKDITVILKRALVNDKELSKRKINISEENLKIIAKFSSSDARKALATLEMLVKSCESNKDGSLNISENTLKACLNKNTLLYDKNGEEHYNIISALHKSMRNSDPDAAVYWLSRMLEAGEDPIYLARRICRFASEDVGLADVNALNLAVNVYHACHFIGMPECSVHLAQAVIYMSLAPKSNSCYIAYKLASSDAKKMLAEPVPLVLRNAPTKLMKELNYGKNYQYAHDSENRLTNMECLPESLKDRKYYSPSTQGNEIKFKERLEYIRKWKTENSSTK